MNELEALANELRMGSSAKAEMAGLNEKNAYNKSMRDSPLAKANRFGHLNPMLGIAQGMKGILGQQKVWDGEDARAAARQKVAAAENSLPLYQAQVAANKVVRDAKEYDDTASALPVAALAKVNDLKAAETKKDTRTKAAAALKATALLGAQGANDVYVTPDGKNPINVSYTKDGPVNTKTGKHVDLTGLITHEHYSKQTNAVRIAQKTGKNEDGDDLDRVGPPDLMAGILDNELLPKATGTLDPRRWAGAMGLGFGDVQRMVGMEGNDEGSRIQALHSNMDKVAIDSVKTNLQGLGINPTDKDLDVAFASIPDKGTQPLAWAMWTRDQYLPMLREAGTNAVAAGTITQEKLDSYIGKVQKSTDVAMTKYGAEGAPAAPTAAQFAGETYEADEEAAYQAYKASMSK
jgi:hypothetical protein